MANKVFNKQLLKKWWFWVAAVAILGLIGSLSPDSSTDTANTIADSNSTTQAVGKLPVLNKADYTSKEGLVVFKDLATKGYDVTAEYVNEAVPATNQEFTKQLANANVNSCSDRLGFDAYVVSDVAQSGDTVSVILTNEPTSNQACPVGTTNDL